MTGKWMTAENGVKAGPYSREQLNNLAKTGKLKPETLVWQEGTTSWMRADRVEGLFAAAGAKGQQRPAQAAKKKTGAAVSPLLIAAIALCGILLVGGSVLAFAGLQRAERTPAAAAVPAAEEESIPRAAALLSARKTTGPENTEPEETGAESTNGNRSAVGETGDDPAGAAEIDEANDTGENDSLAENKGENEKRSKVGGFIKNLLGLESGEEDPGQEDEATPREGASFNGSGEESAEIEAEEQEAHEEPNASEETNQAGSTGGEENSSREEVAASGTEEQEAPEEPAIPEGANQAGSGEEITPSSAFLELLGPGIFGVRQVEQPVTAAFTIFAHPTSNTSLGQVGRAVTFDAGASSTLEGHITTYTWEFSDCGVRVVNHGAGNYTHSRTFDAPGTYTVKLTVTNSAQETASLEKEVTVVAPMRARFSYGPSEPQVNQTITFDASQSSIDGGGSIATYRWSWGDGSSRNETHLPTIRKTFTSPGDYSVRLDIIDENGINTSHARTITVNPPQSLVRITVEEVTLNRGSFCERTATNYVCLDYDLSWFNLPDFNRYEDDGRLPGSSTSLATGTGPMGATGWVMERGQTIHPNEVLSETIIGDFDANLTLNLEARLAGKTFRRTTGLFWTAETYPMGSNSHTNRFGQDNANQASYIVMRLNQDDVTRVTVKLKVEVFAYHSSS